MRSVLRQQAATLDPAKHPSDREQLRASVRLLVDRASNSPNAVVRRFSKRSLEEAFRLLNTSAQDVRFYEARQGGQKQR